MKAEALAFSVAFLVVFVSIGQADRVKVGTIKTLRYEVAGTVYVQDEHTLVIEDFNYNGKTPKTIDIYIVM